MRHEDITRIYDRNARWYDLMQAPMERMGARRWRANLLAGIVGKVLELGVGTGKNLPFYERDAVVTAIDPSTRMLDRARRNASATDATVAFVPGRAERLPFEAAAFDAVVASFVFCSVADPLAGLHEARRVLVPGGRLRLLEHQRPSGRGLAGLFDVLDPIARRVTGASINRPTEENVRRAGFEGVLSQHLDRFGIVRLIHASAPGASAAEGGPHAR